MSLKVSPLAACSTPIFTRIHIASSQRFFGAAWLACVTNYFAVGSAMATQNQPPWSSASQCSRIGFSISSRIRTISRFTITLPKLVLVCGTIATRSLQLEIALLALGIALYLARNVMAAIRKGAVIAFGIALVVIQIGDTYVPRAPLSDKATALGVWIFYTLFVFIALLVERIGARPQTNVPGS